MTEEKKPAVKVTPPEKEAKSQRQLEIEQLRKNRVPAGIPSKNLEFPAREGYVRRVVADHPGRLDKFYNGGWRFVNEDSLDEQNPGKLKASTREGVDSRVSQVIGTKKDNTPMTGYLMEIPEELYNEDQAAKMESLDALEAGLRAGRDAEGGAPGRDGRYVPQHTGIKIEQKGGRQ